MWIILPPSMMPHHLQNEEIAHEKLHKGQRIALPSPYSWINQCYLPRTTTRTNCKKLRQLGKLHLLAPLVWIILIIWGGLPLKSVQMEGLLIRNCTQTTTPSKLSKLLLIVAGIIIEERAGASLLMRTCTKGHDPDYWLSKLPKAPAITNVTAYLLSSQGLLSNLKICFKDRFPKFQISLFEVFSGKEGLLLIGLVGIYIGLVVKERFGGFTKPWENLTEWLALPPCTLVVISPNLNLSC